MRLDLGAAHQALDRWLAGRLWTVKLVLAAGALACVFSYPAFEQAGPRNAEILRQRWGKVAELKAKDPLRDMSRLHPGRSNEAKRTFRITAPAIGYLTRTGSLGAAAFNLLCGYLVLHAAAVLGYLLIGTRAAAAYLTLLLASTYFGSAALNDVFWWFDSVSYAFLLLAALTRNRAMRALALLAAYFSDERALLVSPATALVELPGETAGEGRGRVVAVVLAVAAYAAIRLALETAFSLRTATAGIGLAEARTHWPHAGLALWSAFEGAWIVFGVGLARLARANGGRRALLLAGVLYALAYLAAGFLVQDVTRSLSFGFVFLFPLLGAMRGRLEPQSLHDLLLISALLSLVVPNVFVFNRIEYQVNALSHWLG